jgi:hypothetical protein
MSLMPRHWPGPSGTADPLSIFGQTADVLFAWAYIAPFTLFVPFLLNPPFWVAALSTAPFADRPPENAPPPAPLLAAGPGEKRRPVPLSLVPVRRAT